MTTRFPVYVRIQKHLPGWCPQLYAYLQCPWGILFTHCRFTTGNQRCVCHQELQLEALQMLCREWAGFHKLIYRLLERLEMDSQWGQVTEFSSERILRYLSILMRTQIFLFEVNSTNDCFFVVAWLVVFFGGGAFIIQRNWKMLLFFQIIFSNYFFKCRLKYQSHNQVKGKKRQNFPS